MPRVGRRTDHNFIGRGLTCARPGCNEDYAAHTEWGHDEGRSVRHPDALLVSRNGIRHIARSTGLGFPVCGSPGKYKLMKPSDGVYGLEVCAHCTK